MLEKIVLASNNRGKLAELQAMFAPLGIELIRQADLGISEAEEPHRTFVENALALAALELPVAAVAIELGVALDLILVALVAGVFHERIFAEFGAGDSAALRALRE